VHTHVKKIKTTRDPENEDRGTSKNKGHLTKTIIVLVQVVRKQGYEDYSILLEERTTFATYLVWSRASPGPWREERKS